MSGEAILGFALVAVALATITYLVLVSRRTIDRVAERGVGTAREILNDRR
jgi:hypothetical protein